MYAEAQLLKKAHYKGFVATKKHTQRLLLDNRTLMPMQADQESHDQSTEVATVRHNEQQNKSFTLGDLSAEAQDNSLK